MSHIDQLIDQHRALMAKAAGVQIEICMALGDREGAQRALAEMKAQVEARYAAALGTFNYVAYRPMTQKVEVAA